MRKELITGALVATTAVAAAAPAGSSGAAPTADAALREFEGTIVSKNRDARTFRLRDSERGTVRIRVTRNTRYERIDGFGGLKVGAEQRGNRVAATIAGSPSRSSAPAAAASTAATTTSGRRSACERQ